MIDDCSLLTSLSAITKDTAFDNSSAILQYWSMSALLFKGQIRLPSSKIDKGIQSSLSLVRIMANKMAHYRQHQKTSKRLSCF